MQRRRNTLSCTPEMWSKGCPEYGRLRVSLYGTCDTAAYWEDANAKVLREHQFERGVACPCSCFSRVTGIRIIVHGDDFMSGGPKHQLQWLEEVMDKHFESKHTVMGSSSDLVKSLVILCRTRTIGTVRELSKHGLCSMRRLWSRQLPERERAKALMVRAHENAHGSRCGLLIAKAKRHGCMMYWTQTRRVCTDAQWPGGGQAGHTVRRESVLQVHVEPKSQ